eukprot:scaffold8682_cov136-Skeletonema_marinoi.AAC.3
MIRVAQSWVDDDDNHDGLLVWSRRCEEEPVELSVEPLSVLDPCCCSYVAEKKEVDDRIGDVLLGKYGSEGGSVLGTMIMGLARTGGGGHSGSEVACIPGDNLVDTYDAIRRCWRKIGKCT